jgi:hypothetical protein
MTISNGNWQIMLLVILLSCEVIMIVHVHITNAPLPHDVFSVFGTMPYKKKREYMAPKISSLRLDWTNLPPLSPLAIQIAASQSNCQLDTKSGNEPKEIIKHAIPTSGLGSNIHTWSSGMCHVVEQNKILITTGDWQWRDKTRCPPLLANNSPLSCYFGQHESAARTCLTNTTKSSQGSLWSYGACDKMIEEHGRSAIRAASTEWLFQNVTEIVLRVAEEQIRQTFNGTMMPPPEDLITVHIRWGDKGRETPLLPLSVYIDAVKNLLTREELDGSKPVHIYLATEDPDAKQQFASAAEELHWTMYSSGPKNLEAGSVSMGVLATETNGAAGLDSVAALLVSLQANRYVLGTGSNWSRLINELRKNVLNPRCDNCTRWVNVHGDEDYGET